MNLRRRQFLQIAGALATGPILPRQAFALDYPTRPVKWIVPTAAGSAADIIMRLIGQRLSEGLGQPFVIENRPGAGGNIGAEAVVRAPPDGYTLLNVTTTNMINATLYPTLNFNLIRDIAPVASAVRVPLFMLVNPSVPAKTVPEFIAYAKANPGKLNMAATGTGTPGHVTGELFKMMTGTDLVHVPYRSVSAALTDLMVGQVQVMFDVSGPSIDHIRTGSLRALGVTTAVRSRTLPDLPPIGDSVPGFEASTSGGVGVPAKTPTEIIDKLNREINAALADPKIEGRLTNLGIMVVTGSPADFGRIIAEDTEKWGKVVRFTGMKAE